MSQCTGNYYLISFVQKSKVLQVEESEEKVLVIMHKRQLSEPVCCHTSHNHMRDSQRIMVCASKLHSSVTFMP